MEKLLGKKSSWAEDPEAPQAEQGTLFVVEGAELTYSPV